MRLLMLFGAFALLLASIGLHGVTAYSVTRRTSEIGLRVALGAQHVDVLWLVLRQVVAIAGAGLMIGSRPRSRQRDSCGRLFTA